MTGTDTTAIVDAVTAAVLAAIGTQDTGVVVEAPAKPKARKGATAKKTAPKASAARKPRKRSKVWTVKEEWSEREASPRMIAAAIKAGFTPARIAKLPTQFELSCALGEHYVKAGTVESLDIV